MFGSRGTVVDEADMVSLKMNEGMSGSRMRSDVGSGGVGKSGGAKRSSVGTYLCSRVLAENDVRDGWFLCR